jgi:pimeloyl-ACP methyl ester carboxylesterase
MKVSLGVRAVAGIFLVFLGAAFVFSSGRRYSEKRFVAQTTGCKLDVMSVERADIPEGSESGAVILLHGLSSNKILMSYVARTFAELGLRVFVPDLPGHGRSEGPFTPALAESCALSFARGLSARGMVRPQRTILAGHSMGAAIALRTAGKFRPAGVIALSPAPMVAAHGSLPENLMFTNPPALAPNTLILAAQFEPRGLTANAADLAATSNDPSVHFIYLPGQTHVSPLFSAKVARILQDWTVRVLQLPATNVVPLRTRLLGCVLGFVGILLLTGPFLRELAGKQASSEVESGKGISLPSALRLCAEFFFVSCALAAVFRYWIPLRGIHLYQGDYVASYFLLMGLALLALHPKLFKTVLAGRGNKNFGALAAALVGGLLLFLLISGWFELTASGAWLSLQRWVRLPIFAVAAFAYLYAMEVLVGPVNEARAARRLWFSVLLFVLGWLPLVGGVLYFQTGQFVLVLLAPYFAISFLLFRTGTQLVRRVTASAAAAAIFGAILLAGFSVILFPLS